MRIPSAGVSSALALSVIVCAAVSARAGEIVGAVTDDGRAVAGAAVSVENEATGERGITQTDAGGKFIVSRLPPGKYNVNVSVPAANSEYDQRVEVSEGKTSEVAVQLVTIKSVILPYFINLLCGALVLIILDAWLRLRGVRDPSLIWLYLTLLSWAIPKIPTLMGWPLRVNVPPVFGWQLPLKVIEPNQIKYLFSFVSNLCFAWTAFQLSRVRDLFGTYEQFRRCRGVIVWWIVFPLSLVALALQFSTHDKVANVIDALAATVACFVFLIGLSYSFYRYNNWLFIGYTWVTILPFIYRQFYVALSNTPRTGIRVPLSLMNSTMLIMLFIALAVAWALSNTARLKTVKISPKVYIVAMFFDLRGSTRWADEVMEGDFDSIRDFIDELREWVLDEASRVTQGSPTFVKFLGDGFMYIWEIQKSSMKRHANVLVELACDLSSKYPSWVKKEGLEPVLPWKPPDGIGLGVDVNYAIRLTYENGSDDYLGSPVSLAAKMQNKARPRGVVIQERVWELLEERVADRFPNAGVMKLGEQEIQIHATKDVSL